MEQKIPFRISIEEEKFLHIKYSFYPEPISKNTINRIIIHNEEEPKIGYIDHIQENGEIIKFRGIWTDFDEENKGSIECALLFNNDEVVCVPINSLLNQLRNIQ